MKTEWMGRYRQLMRALVNHTNSACRYGNIRMEIKDGICLNHYDWQVLEYLYEHEDNDENMLHMSHVLGLAQSSFSNITKTLCHHHLVKRYHTRTNKKSVILKITDEGKSLYEHHVTAHLKAFFSPMFAVLDELSDEQLDVFIRALDTFNRVDEQTDNDLIPE